MFHVERFCGFYSPECAVFHVEHSFLLASPLSAMFHVEHCVEQSFDVPRGTGLILRKSDYTSVSGKSACALLFIFLSTGSLTRPAVA
jgi:hypothetical protein